MTRSCRVTLLGLGLVAALITAACAADGSGLVADPPEPTHPASKTVPNRFPKSDPLADPASPRRIHYTPMLISDPLPTPPPAIAVNSDEAMAIAKRDQDFGSAMQPGVPTASLRMVTIGSPDDKPAPRLAWVLTWRNSRMDLHGPPTLSAEKRAEMVANAKCVFVVVVDATTGSTEYVTQLCR